jgi:hypothetical protein
MELSLTLMTPSCTGLTEVHVGKGLGLVVLRADISRSAASSFPDVDD